MKHKPTDSDIDRLKRLRPKLGMRPEDFHPIADALHATTARLGTRDMAAVYDAARLGVDFRRRHIDEYLRRTLGDRVQSGPFRGMRYIERSRGSLFSPKLLGTYELELHAIIEACGVYSVIFNVGCGEGWYAVGLARRFPHIEVIAADTDARARADCHALAQRNEVADRVRIVERFDPSTLSAHARTLVLMDVESAEIDLVRAIPTEPLATTDLLIETHPGPGGSTALPLIDALAPTHDIQVIWQQARDFSAFEALRVLGELDRLLAMWEGRPSADPWLWCTARERPSSST